MQQPIHINADGRLPENVQPRHCAVCERETIHAYTGWFWTFDEDLGRQNLAHGWKCAEPDCGGWLSEISYDYPDEKGEQDE